MKNTYILSYPGFSKSFARHNATDSASWFYFFLFHGYTVPGWVIRWWLDWFSPLAPSILQPFTGCTFLISKCVVKWFTCRWVNRFEVLLPQFSYTAHKSVCPHSLEAHLCLEWTWSTGTADVVFGFGTNSLLGLNPLLFALCAKLQQYHHFYSYIETGATLHSTVVW